MLFAMSGCGSFDLIHLQAENYDSYYVYSAKTHNTLRVGSSVIEEILEREVQKYEEELRRQEREAEERKAHEEKVSNVTITYNAVVIDLPTVSWTNTSSTIASR